MDPPCSGTSAGTRPSFCPIPGALVAGRSVLGPSENILCVGSPRGFGTPVRPRSWPVDYCVRDAPVLVRTANREDDLIMAHHNRFPNRRRMYWKGKALRQLAQFTKDSPRLAWHDAIYWGHYRHVYVWRIRTAEAMILAAPRFDGWHIGAVWPLRQWQRFVQRQEQRQWSANS